MLEAGCASIAPAFKACLEYLASTFVENEYAEMNDLLNRVELTVAVGVWCEA